MSVQLGTKELGCWIRYEMDDQHIIVKTLRVTATGGKLKALAGHPSLAVTTRLNAVFQQHPVEVFFAPVPVSTARVTAATIIPDLPPNVHLQTFRTSLRCVVRTLLLWFEHW